jgi:hypothetical protein
MRIPVLALLAFAAGAAHAQGERRPNPMDPQAKVPPVEFRSAFEGYRPFADQDRRDWRGANDELGSAGGHGGQRPAQGSGEQSSKPQPGKPAHQDHGGHK